MSFSVPAFTSLLEYWKSCATGSGIPSSSTFDLICIPTLLPDATLWEIDRNHRIFCRMTGTNVVERMGTDITGRYLGDIMPSGYEEELTRHFQTIRAHPCGLYLVALNRHPNSKLVRVETLVVPLAASKGHAHKFVSLNHMMQVLGFDGDRTDTKTELGRSLEHVEYIDLGWGLPEKPF